MKTGPSAYYCGLADPPGVPTSTIDKLIVNVDGPFGGMTPTTDLHGK